MALAISLPACDKKPAATAPAAAPPHAEVPPAALPVARQLAAARLDAATTCIEKNSQDEALALLVAACKADPSFTAASSLMRSLLAETVWNIPITTLNHQLPVQQLAFVPPASLWVSLAEATPALEAELIAESQIFMQMLLL